MSTGNKLADLKALASSAVAEESSRAVSLLKQPVATTSGRTSGRDQEPSSKPEGKTSKRGRSDLLAVTRVPSVLRPKDMKAINAAKIYLMQGGRTGVSTNNIIQMALRSMKVGPELLKLAEEILAEDGRRK